MSNQNNGEIIPAKQKMASLRQLLMSDKVSAQIMSALRGGVEDKRRMFRVYMTAMQTTPRILECDQISVIGAIMQAAQVGLSLDTVFGEGFLIPRYNKHTGGQVCGFQIGYKGLCKLARTSDPGVRDIYARVVYQNDRFDYSYEPKTLVHTPCEDPDARGPLKYAYAKVIWREDNYDRFVVVSAAEIRKAQDASDSFKKKFGPWIDNPDAMWAKTALRRLCNTLSLNAESDLAKAMVAEDAESGGKHILTGLDVDLSLPPPVQSSSDQDPLTRLADQEPNAKAQKTQSRRRRPEPERSSQQQAAPDGAPSESGHPEVSDPRTGEKID